MPSEPGDYILGNNNNNVIYGSSANDLIFGLDGEDWLYGGFGDDKLSGGDGNDKLHGGWGDDVFYSWGSGVDEYYGNVGNDTFFLGFENDGYNQIDGGKGIDTVDYSWSSASVAISVSSGTIGGSYGDFFESIENARGSFYNDVIFGSREDNHIEGQGGDDHLLGRIGDDRLEGGSGDDKLDGGAGYDLLLGGSGADTFIFSYRDDTTNAIEDWGTIQDFNRMQGDKIDLSEATDTLFNAVPLEYVGGSNFTGIGIAEVRVSRDFFGETTVYVDSDGDGIANGQFGVELMSSFSSFGESDFIL